MAIQTEISFRHMGHSAALEESVRQRVEKLARFHPRITTCRVVIEASNRKNSTKAVVYRVRVDAIVPGGEIVAEREPSLEPDHEDVNVAIRDAFDSLQRELQDHVGRQRGDVKAREPRPHGRVVRIFHDRGYGFLEGEDGYDVYFHQNSVVDGAFNRLEVGDEVRFEEEEGDRGPQASTVAFVAKASAQKVA